MTNILRWIFLSSKDPKKVSASVLFALLATVPFILQALGITCVLWQICLDITADQLTEFFTHVANLVMFLMSAVGSLGFIYAFLRKIVLTWTGENKVLE